MSGDEDCRMNVLEEDISLILKQLGPLDMLKDSTILVTGGGGLIGSMLVRTLKAAKRAYGFPLRILALSRTVSRIQYLEGDGVELLGGDICDPLDIPEKLDYIIHCASVTKSAFMAAQPVETLLTSILGTKNVLDLARTKEVRSMVYLSSMEMYGTGATTADKNGQFLEDAGVTEDMLGYIDLSNPRSSYPEGKRASECLCQAYCSQYGVPVRIARLAQTFGAGVARDDSRVFAQFARSAEQRNNIILHTQGQSEGNYCYLADTLLGILTILLKGQGGQAYNIANETLHMTIKDMADLVAGEVAQPPVKVVVECPEDSGKHGYAPETRLFLNAEKLRGLGWQPRYSMADMYRRMIMWWAQQARLEQTTTLQ